MFSGFKNSSKSISPGWVGGRFLGSFRAILLFVVVCNFDLISVTFLPNKTNTVLLIYPDAELIFSIAF